MEKKVMLGCQMVEHRLSGVGSERRFMSEVETEVKRREEMGGGSG